MIIHDTILHSSISVYCSGFVAKLQGSLFKFKLVNEIGAEQLMIDLFSFRSYFTQRIVINSWKGKELAR